MTNSVQKKESTLIDQKYRKINFSSWIPKKVTNQMVILHGYAEHYRRYEPFAARLAERGTMVHMMDFPGHGLSEGDRGHIDDFQEYIDNVEWFFNSNPNYDKSLPTFLFGHSMGGLIGGHYCLQNTPDIRGLILSAPLFGFPLATQPIRLLAELLKKKYSRNLFPKPFAYKTLSRSPEQWKLYRSDPLRVQLISPQLMTAMHRYAGLFQDNAKKITSPVLIFASSRDKVVSPDAIRTAFKKIGSRDKTLVTFTESMHEIIQEFESTQLEEKMRHWMSQRLFVTKGV